MSGGSLPRRPTSDRIIARSIAPAPWPSSRPILGLVVEVLPTIDDALAADLLEHLALALCERDDELRAVRAVLSAALAITHAQHVENVRVRGRLAELLDTARRGRLAA